MMLTYVMAWVELSIAWTSPAVTMSAGPVVYMSRTPYSLAVDADTVMIEPASFGFEFVSRELEIESRVSAWLLVPP